MAEWHDGSLNRDYPPDPGPWRQPECDRFNAASAVLLADIRAELGPEFEVIDRQARCEEDPELDKAQRHGNGPGELHDDDPAMIPAHGPGTT